MIYELTGVIIPFQPPPEITSALEAALPQFVSRKPTSTPLPFLQAGLQEQQCQTYMEEDEDGDGDERARAGAGGADHEQSQPNQALDLVHQSSQVHTPLGKLV